MTSHNASSVGANVTSDDLQGHGRGLDFVFEFIVPGVLLNAIGILGLVGKYDPYEYVNCSP